MEKNRFLLLLSILLPFQTFSDNFVNNTSNNFGIIGLINMPTARMYDESTYSFNYYYGEKDQKISMTAYPFEWLEASVFYANLNERDYCDDLTISFCNQDQKDKGFNLKIRLLEETDFLPSIAIGINDAGGTGYFSSEYIVGSYGIGNLDMHFGLGWGNLDGKKEISNPFLKLSDSFRNRSIEGDLGGRFETSSFFSGDTTSPFFGISYLINDDLVLKIERDTTSTPGRVGYDEGDFVLSFGLDFLKFNNISFGLGFERGDYISFRFSYKNNPKETKPRYEYKQVDHNEKDSKYVKLRRILRANGIGVNKIIEGKSVIGVEMTQFTHPNLNVIDEIIKRASYDAGLIKPVKADLRIADLKVVSEYDEEFIESGNLVYDRKSGKKFFTDTNLTIRPFIASREGFFKGAILLENNSEFIIRDDLFFSTNLKYSIIDNFDDLTIPPVDTFPAQVRSDVKDYLRNYQDSIIIGRAQLDYHLTPKSNHYLMASAGILEEMFMGAGFEYLFFKQDTNFAAGFEIFNVKKRDYQMAFGTLDYENTVGSINFYYRNYNTIPFDAKISYGEYLAGDVGTTIELSRSFENGVTFGFFASSTNVSAEQFGEGSFDKGIFFDIPIFGNLVGYSWRPLTKDPGQKLARKHTLYDLLVKFKPIN